MVKPVSLDLVRPEAITRKAYQYSGQFPDLEDLAGNNNYLFDVILARPKPQALNKAYDNARRILEKQKSVNLIGPDELESYSRATAEQALL